jgi:large subunit ribosomal protein L18
MISSRITRHKRIRAKIFGTAKRPRLAVFRSNQHIYGQLIDDEAGRTLVAVSDHILKGSIGSKEKVKDGKRGVSRALEAGKLIAQKAKEKSIKNTVFDRGGYKYHGRIKAFAEGAREGGLEF